MLRKRTRSHQKDQQMSYSASDSMDSLSNSDAFLKQKLKTNSFFRVSGLFVGLSAKVPDCDSVRSPTSPLEYRVLSKSNIVNPFRFPKPSNEGTQKSWDSQKVGLGILNSLDDDCSAIDTMNSLRSSESRNILFGPQMRNKTPDFIARLSSVEATRSLPKDCAIFAHSHIKPSIPQMSESGNFLSFSLDSASFGSHWTEFSNRRTEPSSGNSPLGNESKPIANFCGSKLKPLPISNDLGADILTCLSASEIELSEEYTCVRTHGPNPKTTHIYGDRILECHNNELFITSLKNQVPETPLASPVECTRSEVPLSYPSDNFLSFCYSCKKKLEGEDIYMYRGDKAFCSGSCRSEEILIEEKMENGSFGNTMECEELSETSMFIAA